MLVSIGFEICFQPTVNFDSFTGRSFIQPSMRLRRLAVAKKFGPLAQNFSGKSIILIDDSIVRGNQLVFSFFFCKFYY